LSEGSVQEVADRLVDEAVDNGGHDNVTVLVAEVVAGPESRGTDRPAIPMARSEQALRPSSIPENGPGVVRASLASASCILAAAVLVLGMYAHQGWFIGSDDGDVAVFRGRPSGLLWFEPTLVEGGDLRVASLDEPTRIAVGETIVVGSLDEARRLIEGFRGAVNGA